MIEEITLTPNEDLPPVKIKWSEDKEDYIIDIPEGITRLDLISLTEEVKQLTEWKD